MLCHVWTLTVKPVFVSSSYHCIDSLKKKKIMLYEWSLIGRRNVQFKPRRCRRCWDPVLQIGSLIVSHKKSTNRKVFLKNSRYLVYFCWGLHLWPLLTLAARLRASSNENIPSKAVPPQNNTWNPISIKGTFQNYFFRQKSLFFLFIVFAWPVSQKEPYWNDICFLVYIFSSSHLDIKMI